MHTVDMTRKGGKAQLRALESWNIVALTGEEPEESLQNPINKPARVQR
jgi:hypothetical protein